jgi:hypothetical protein
MITSFFKISRPFHFFLILILAIGLFIYFRRWSYSSTTDYQSMLIEGAVFLVVMLSLAVQSFIVSKNRLTQKNSYSSLLVVLFFACVPETLKDNNLLIANVFIIMAIRRLISLKSNIDIKKKLFDATFWIGIASLFYFWSIGFLLLVIASLLVFALGDLKNWIIPFIALITLSILVTSYSVIIHNSFFDYMSYVDDPSFDFEGLYRLETLVGLTLIVILILWSLIFYIKKIAQLFSNRRLTHILILCTLFIAIVCALLTSNKTGAEVVFVFFPLSVMLTNYIEQINNKLWSDAIFYLIIAVAIGVSVLPLYAIS